VEQDRDVTRFETEFLSSLVSGELFKSAQSHHVALNFREATDTSVELNVSLRASHNLVGRGQGINELYGMPHLEMCLGCGSIAAS
jgi:hypothetical protein